MNNLVAIAVNLSQNERRLSSHLLELEQLFIRHGVNIDFISRWSYYIGTFINYGIHISHRFMNLRGRSYSLFIRDLSRRSIGLLYWL